MPGDAVGQHDNEPTIGSRLTIEALTDDGWRSYPAWVADLTERELWVALEQGLAGSLDPGRSVRLVISHPEGPAQVADTVILWHIGKTGNLVALKRPRLWDPPSRREHTRVKLAFPVYLRADESSEPVPATSTDIGVGGLFCLAAMDLRIGQRIDAAIQIAPDCTFECQAEVARLDEDPDDPFGLQLMVGLHFLDMTSEDQASLAETVVRLARDADDDFVPRPWRHEADDLQSALSDAPSAAPSGTQCAAQPGEDDPGVSGHGDEEPEPAAEIPIATKSTIPRRKRRPPSDLPGEMVVQEQPVHDPAPSDRRVGRRSPRSWSP